MGHVIDTIFIIKLYCIIHYTGLMCCLSIFTENDTNVIFLCGIVTL